MSGRGSKRLVAAVGATLLGVSVTLGGEAGATLGSGEASVLVVTVSNIVANWRMAARWKGLRRWKGVPARWTWIWVGTG